MLLRKQKIPKYLFTLEIANNHMGDVEHGINLIQAFGDICKKYPFNFGFKFQYRALDSFIHPKMKNRDDLKYEISCCSQPWWRMDSTSW